MQIYSDNLRGAFSWKMRNVVEGMSGRGMLNTNTHIHTYMYIHVCIYKIDLNKEMPHRRTKRIPREHSHLHLPFI